MHFGKTKSQALVEPIIDLLRFEKQVIGGDAVLLKKALKGIGQLGKKHHAPLLEAAFGDIVAHERAASMQEAVALAARNTKPGGAVLLSPACASFDMFDNFEHRGRVFKDCVQAYAKGVTQ